MQETTENKDNRFLSVARHLRYIDEYQAHDVYQEHLRRKHFVPQLGESMVGRVAVDFLYLTEEKVQSVLERQRQFRTDGEYYDVVVKEVITGNVESRLPGNLDKFRLIFNALVVPAALLSYFITRSAEAVIPLLILWEGTSILFEVLRPVLLKLILTRYVSDWSQVPLRLASIGVALSLILIFSTVVQLVNLAQSGTAKAEDVVTLWHRFIKLLTVSVVCFLLVLARLQWRKYVISLLRWRLDQRKGLGSLQTYAVAEFAKSSTLDQDQLDNYTKQVIKRLASILLLNPWDEPLEKLRGWPKWLLPESGPSLGTVVVWYVVPTDTGEFEVVQHAAAPRVEAEVDDALGRLRNIYKPAPYDAPWFHAAQVKCTDNTGKFNLPLFLTLEERSKKVSLAGYVHKLKNSMSSRNPSAARYFDTRFRSMMEDDQRKLPFLKDLLQVTAFAATSVHALDAEAVDPYGVIVVWKRALSPESISIDDEAALVTAAHVLSVITQTWRQRRNALRQH